MKLLKEREKHSRWPLLLDGHRGHLAIKGLSHHLSHAKKHGLHDHVVRAGERGHWRIDVPISQIWADQGSVYAWRVPKICTKLKQIWDFETTSSTKRNKHEFFIARTTLETEIKIILYRAWKKHKKSVEKKKREKLKKKKEEEGEKKKKRNEGIKKRKKRSSFEQFTDAIYVICRL